MIDTGLEKKVVIVTGGSAGIGRATVRAFAAERARVAVWDVNDAEKDEVLGEISAAGGEGLFRGVDVTDVGSVRAGVEEVVDQWGGINVLVNNAGIVRDAQLVKWKDGQAASIMSDEQFDAVLGVNLKGVFHCTREVVPHLIEGGGGAILNATSVVGLYGNFGQTNYAATKGAVITMTRTWARELGRFKIRVNAVAPGFIGTEILRSMPEKVLEGMVAHTPMGRIGEPEDIADTYVWLASDRATFVHGAVISVDGGLVIGT
jgi:3-oxoacyl-[acyl-carrier protein] reductase